MKSLLLTLFLAASAAQAATVSAEFRCTPTNGDGDMFGATILLRINSPQVKVSNEWIEGDEGTLGDAAADGFTAVKGLAKIAEPGDILFLDLGIVNGGASGRAVFQPSKEAYDCVRK